MHESVARCRSFLAWLPMVGLLACDSGARTFPPEVPVVRVLNESAGDPYAGRFPLEKALAGLPSEGTLTATFVTEIGEVRCQLYESNAPLTVANFVGLARGLRPFLDEERDEWVEQPYYDGVAFHRAEEQQFVQGGRRGSAELPGYRIQDEISVGDAFASPGMLAMANSGFPHSGGAQFFITTTPQTVMNGKYAIFGYCSDRVIVRELERRTLAGESIPLKTVRIERE